MFQRLCFSPVVADAGSPIRIGKPEGACGSYSHGDVIKWNNFHVTGPLCGEFTGHRWIPPTKASVAELRYFFHLRLIKRLSKQSWRRLFQTPSRSLWRHCNDRNFLYGLTNCIKHSNIKMCMCKAASLECGWVFFLEQHTEPTKVHRQICKDKFVSKLWKYPGCYHHGTSTTTTKQFMIYIDTK